MLSPRVVTMDGQCQRVFIISNQVQRERSISTRLLNIPMQPIWQNKAHFLTTVQGQASPEVTFTVGQNTPLCRGFTSTQTLPSAPFGAFVTRRVKLPSTASS